MLLTIALAAPAQPPLLDLPKSPFEAPMDEARGLEQRPRVETEDVLLFLPRALLAGPRVVLMGLWLPLRGGLRYADEQGLIGKGSTNSASPFRVEPTLEYYSSYGLTAGLNLSHHPSDQATTALRARVGGRVRYAAEASFQDTKFAAAPLWTDLRIGYAARPSLLYRDNEQEGWYSEEHAYARLSGGVGDEQFRAGIIADFDRRRFGDSTGHGGRRTSVGEVFDTAPIASFDTGSDVVELRGLIETSREEGLIPHGTALLLFGGGAPGAYWRYGGELRSTVDLYRGDRLLSGHVIFDAVHGEDIPFAHLPTLGSIENQRGWRPDRYRGKRMVLAGIDYRYPIHAAVMGELFVDAGNVAATYTGLIDGWHLAGGGSLIFGGAESLLLRLDLSFADDVRFGLSTDLAPIFERKL